jgi:hypothetical protein
MINPSFFKASQDINHAYDFINSPQMKASAELIATFLAALPNLARPDLEP